VGELLMSGNAESMTTVADSEEIQLYRPAQLLDPTPVLGKPLEWCSSPPELVEVIAARSANRPLAALAVSQVSVVWA